MASLYSNSSISSASNREIPDKLSFYNNTEVKKDSGGLDESLADYDGGNQAEISDSPRSKRRATRKIHR